LLARPIEGLLNPSSESSYALPGGFNFLSTVLDADFKKRKKTPYFLHFIFYRLQCETFSEVI
jgi:hypothetical protein